MIRFQNCPRASSFPLVRFCREKSLQFKVAIVLLPQTRPGANFSQILTGRNWWGSWSESLTKCRPTYDCSSQEFLIHMLAHTQPQELYPSLCDYLSRVCGGHLLKDQPSGKSKKSCWFSVCLAFSCCKKSNDFQVLHMLEQN